MEFKKDNDEIQWQKEQEQDKKRFDFAAFLGPDGLDDRVTEAVDGKDLLEPDAFDHITSDYVPRRRSDGEHGLHEAPEPPQEFQPETAPESPQAPERPTMNPDDPRYAAPERPHVVVADPHPKRVYVSPVGDDYDSSPSSDGGSGKSGLTKAIVVLAIIAVVLLAMLGGLFGSSDDDDTQATPKPTSPAASTDSPTPTNTPANTSSTAQPTKRSYTITVTAGSGGSITPSGAVSVEEGGSVTFAIVPNSGYVISQLLVDGVAVATQDNYTFTNVTSAHTIYAVFQAAPAATPTATPAPTATPSPTPAPTAEPTPDPTAPPAQDEPTQQEPEAEPEAAAEE
jgi:hypothetical protein